MSVTDLLSRIPFSPGTGREPEARPAEPRRTFAVEVPGAEGPARDVGPAFVARKRPATPDAPGPRAPALPGWAALVIGALVLVCIALATALAAAWADDAADPAPAPPAAEAAPPAPTFSADPTPIPVDLLTALEAVGQEPIEVELGQLLMAIDHGFGTRSARLEPTLQSYVYRMGSRFEWSDASFRVAVTAPDAALARARGDLLARLFAPAVAAGHLRIGTGVGPHALTLVSPTTE